MRSFYTVKIILSQENRNKRRVRTGSVLGRDFMTIGIVPSRARRGSYKCEVIARGERIKGTTLQVGNEKRKDKLWLCRRQTYVKDQRRALLLVHTENEFE